MKSLDLTPHNVAGQLDEPPFHLKIVEEMCNYRIVAAKKIDFDSKKEIWNFLQGLKNIFFVH